MSGMTPPPKLRELTRQRRFATPRAVSALMLREMSTTYGRTPMGYLWAIVQPVAGIILLTLVFSLFLNAPPMGTSFAIFYATGMLPYTIYQDINTKLATSIQFSRQLLIYPSVTALDAVVARFILNFITQILVFYIVVIGLFLIFDSSMSLNYPALALSMAMLAALSFGVGVTNAILFGLFPAWQQVWGILNRPMFLFSGILFLFESIPEPYRSYMWYNPLIHIIGQMRHAFYPYYDIGYVSPLYVFVFSLILICLGIGLLYRYTLRVLNI